jgi:VanZ family protein
VSSFPISSPFDHFDKIAHFCLYAGLSATVAMGLHRARREYSAKVLFIIPVGFSIIYGLNDEVHQLFVDYRTFAAGDIAADAVGAAAAAAFLLFVYRRKKSKR